MRARPVSLINPKGKLPITEAQRLQIIAKKIQQAESDIAAGSRASATSLATVASQMLRANQRIASLEAIAGIGEGKRVLGADIYVQPTEPTASGDWVWIDTSLVDIFNS
ncbi:MAG TPA: hypothetical protein PL124_03075 [Candidatus Cloacimonadota bacterium]|nr:hypothetical protein [Candidatus Cloacimonadota bacterium]HPS38375.1 hypothetical protein [Candidatus Cloacimonadota bacterium]